MKLKTKIEYLQHLKEVSTSYLVYKAGESYIDDLARFYKCNKFSKNHFQKLVSQEYGVLEQDVVTDLFYDAQQVSAEEIFLYLFKKVKLIAIVESNHFSDNSYAGTNNSFTHAIYINRSKIRNKKIDAKKNDKDNNYTRKNNDINQEALKDIIYHEFSHLFETRYYYNERFIEGGINCDIIQTKGQTDFNIFYCTDSLYTISGLTNEKLGDIDLQLYGQINSGLKSLSECYNEMFSVMTNQCMQKCVKENPYELKKYISKTRFDNHTGYDDYYDAIKLINLVTFGNDFDVYMYRFYPKLFIDKINNLSVSSNVMEKVQNLILQNIIKLNDSQKHFLEKNNIDIKLDIISIIALCVNEIQYTTKHSKNNNYIYKILLQIVLLDAMKNKIAQEIYNENVTKDMFYFINLDKILSDIDKVILYPNTCYNSLKKVVKSIDKKNDTLDKEITASEEKLIQYCEGNQHIRSFFEIITIMKKNIDIYRKCIPNLEKGIPYLCKKIQYDKKMKSQDRFK